MPLLALPLLIPRLCSAPKLAERPTHGGLRHRQAWPSTHWGNRRESSAEPRCLPGLSSAPPPWPLQRMQAEPGVLGWQGLRMRLHMRLRMRLHMRLQRSIYMQSMMKPAASLLCAWQSASEGWQMPGPLTVHCAQGGRVHGRLRKHAVHRRHPEEAAQCGHEACRAAKGIAGPFTRRGAGPVHLHRPDVASRTGLGAKQGL